jgi:uncharacterized repeat protein (TIGR03803 family)
MESYSTVFMKQMKFLLGILGVLMVCFCDATVRGGVTFTNLFSFSGTNGIEPEGQLVQTPDGNLYGTARDTTLEKWGNGNFGFNGNGSIFRIATNGAFSVLATFAHTNGNGAYPRAGLTLGKDGILYGTTTGGGLNRQGTVFKITTNGTLTILALFAGTNGALPVAGLLRKGDAFLGTTLAGGIKDRMHPGGPNDPVGMGTVFSINSAGIINTLIFFDKTNGEFPNGELIQGNDGNLYGTTSFGGFGWLVHNNLTNQFSEYGYGTLFKITPHGAFSTLAAFNGYNGQGPTAIRLSKDGSLYGITSNGGATNTANPDETYAWQPFSGSGTIFKITPKGEFKTLVLFNGVKGSNPDSFILGNDGNFYGTTSGGGANNLGTIFKLTPNGTFTTLYSFTEGSGSWPNGFRLMQGIDRNLYGTTKRSGQNQCGSIFRLTLPQ